MAMCLQFQETRISHFQKVATEADVFVGLLDKDDGIADDHASEGDDALSPFADHIEQSLKNELAQLKVR